MALRDTWQRALVYFGLAEDPDYREHDIYEPDTVSHGQETSAPRGSASVSRISERRRARNGADVQVHLVTPHSFNDAQEVADRFKRSVPVILNLQATEGELAKRLIDFASGLTYALEGGMQKIAEKTFLLTPRNVEVSAEEKARLVEKGFFNQS